MKEGFSRYRRVELSPRRDELPRIVIADDEAVTRTFLRATLKAWGYSVEVANNGTEAWELLAQAGGASLAIVDWMMPGLDGPGICRRVREIDDRYVYVLLLTAKTDKADLVAGLDAGADDYVIKPFDVEELRARLRTGMRIVELEEQLRIRATRDALTGLWSRGALFEILTRELDRAKRSKRPLSLLLADLDHFKRVNDQFGHLGGDAALREAAARIQKAVRTYDIVGRYGGEEILIVLPECDQQSTAAVAERIRETMAATPITLTNASIHLTVSVGGTTADDAAASIESLIARADAALYKAKSLGRNRVEFGTQP